MSISSEVIVTNSVGLHARPAAQFVKTAASFKCKVSVENLSKSTSPVNAKSLLSVLSIGVQKDDKIRITVEGENEQTAMDAILELVNHNFGE